MEKLNLSQLQEIHAIMEKVEGLYRKDIPEDTIQELLNPFEKILTDNGVNLQEQDF